MLIGRNTISIKVFLGITIIVLIALVAGCTQPQTQNTNPTTAPVSTAQVEITAVNLAVAYQGETTGYFGAPDQVVSQQVNTYNAGQDFTITLPLTSVAAIYTHNVNNFGITTSGFTLLNINPSPPITMVKGASVAFTLTVQAPDYQYTGPIDITLYTT